MIEQCAAITDDIIIYGYKDDGSDHDKTVRSIMYKAQEAGMQFNLSKCQFKKTEVIFLECFLIDRMLYPTLLKLKL